MITKVTAVSAALTYLLTATDLDVQLLVIRGISLGTWVCCKKKKRDGVSIDRNTFTKKTWCLTLVQTHPYNDADGWDTRGGHHFGTVGDEVEQDGNDGFCPMVEFIPQYWRQVTAQRHQWRQKEVHHTVLVQFNPNVLSVACACVVKYSRHSDTGLSDHLGAQVLCRQFEGSV